MISLSILLGLYCGSGFAGTVLIEPGLQTVTSGQSLSVDVDITGVSDLFAFQFDLAFDPSVLSATAVREGRLFSAVGVSFSPGFVDNATGVITFIGDSLSSPGSGISADGTLATISFNSIAAGASALDLSNVILLDSGLADISASISGASVRVERSSGAVPEPDTFVLALLGGAAAVCFRSWSQRRKALSEAIHHDVLNR